MARCWSCGTQLSGGVRHIITCPTCSEVEELKALRKEVSKSGGLGELAAIQEQGFQGLSNTLAEGLSSVVSAIEWGFEDLSWRLHEQTEVLKSIEHTLQTPRETQGEELRTMAEELRNREVLDEAEHRFLDALDLNPLDYRIYIGLVHTYLQMGKFDEAKNSLEKSLPHAPIQTPQTDEPYSEWDQRLYKIQLDLRWKLNLYNASERERIAFQEIDTKMDKIHDAYKEGSITEIHLKDIVEQLETVYEGSEEGLLVKLVDIEKSLEEKQESVSSQDQSMVFDYKSYSYRLIGRICFCNEDYPAAVTALRESIHLSPTYYDGHYDYAQYCALVGDRDGCVSSLGYAIGGNHLHFYLAQKESNFDHLRRDVQDLLDTLYTEALDEARQAISKSQEALQLFRQTLLRAEDARSKSEGSLKTWEGGHMWEETGAEFSYAWQLCNPTLERLNLATVTLASGDYLDLLQIPHEWHEFAQIAETVTVPLNILARFCEDIRSPWYVRVFWPLITPRWSWWADQAPTTKRISRYGGPKWQEWLALIKTTTP